MEQKRRQEAEALAKQEAARDEVLGKLSVPKGPVPPAAAVQECLKVIAMPMPEGFPPAMQAMWTQAQQNMQSIFHEMQKQTLKAEQDPGSAEGLQGQGTKAKGGEREGQENREREADPAVQPRVRKHASKEASEEQAAGTPAKYRKSTVSIDDDMDDAPLLAAIPSGAPCS